MLTYLGTAHPDEAGRYLFFGCNKPDGRLTPSMQVIRITKGGDGREMVIGNDIYYGSRKGLIGLWWKLDFSIDWLMAQYTPAAADYAVRELYDGWAGKFIWTDFREHLTRLQKDRPWMGTNIPVDELVAAAERAGLPITLADYNKDKEKSK